MSAKKKPAERGNSGAGGLAWSHDLSRKSSACQPVALKKKGEMGSPRSMSGEPVFPSSFTGLENQEGVFEPKKGVTPLCNTGVGNLNRGRMSECELVSCRYDMLRVMGGKELSRELEKHTEFCERVSGTQGFLKGERRACLGGTCRRYLDPHQASNRYGLDYERWEFSGMQGDTYTLLFFREWKGLGRKGYAKRIDIAFDFKCPEDYYPREFTADHESGISAARLKLQHAGPVIEGTRYVGARTSERYLRIYRKDLEDGQVARSEGPMMRVELELKHGAAEALWDLYTGENYTGGYEDGFRLAAAHIESMTGFKVMDWLGDDLVIPQIEKHRSGKGVDRVFQLVKQYGGIIRALDDLGIDVIGLSRERDRLASKSSRSRIKGLLAELKPWTAAEVTQSVCGMLQGAKAS